MKHLKRVLCLLLVLTMVGAALAACGGAEEPAVTTTGDTTANTTGGDITTVPPATQPPVTDPPATEPPATAAPCEKHIWAEGSKCTEERTCTVCQETVPAGEHTCSDLPCTVDRVCMDCGHVLTAMADHVYGKLAACGTKKCENCDVAVYGDGCVRADDEGLCAFCRLPSSTAIPFVNVGGISVKNFTVVIPTYEKNLTHDYEHYLSALLRHRLDQYHRAGLQTVSDSAEKIGPEIRIGKTNRTVTECPENTYIIRVVNGDLEILCDGMHAYEGLLKKLDEMLGANQKAGITFSADTDITASFSDRPEDALMGELRVMYHNIWNWSSKPIDTRSRFSMFKQLYTHYAPDILCFQEAPADYFTIQKSLNLRAYLSDIGYKSLNVGKGSHPIFYRGDNVKLLAHGFESKGSGYGTSWALFQHRKTGKYFGVGNSHFTAGSMVKEGQTLEELQLQDAQALLRAKEKILSAATEKGVENVDTMPLIFGGDYNSRVGSAPINRLEMKGLVNVRRCIEDADMVDDYRTYGSEFDYIKAYDYHVLNPYKKAEGKGLTDSIDHIYLKNEGVSFTAHQYRVIHNLIAGGCADHQPHYVDISFQ